jgi:type II secretory pathway pseudopilin PulG
MKKGFSILELIVYISLVSVLMTGVFSLVLSYVRSGTNHSDFTDADYEKLIKNYHE